MQHFPDAYCRKCDAKNSVIYFAPVFVPQYDSHKHKPHATGIGSHICYSCADARHWVDRNTGNLREGISL